MARRKQSSRRRRQNKQRGEQQKQQNKTIFREVLNWLVSEGELFTEERFHGNIKWKPEQLAAEALIWSWQEANNVTDAFDQTLEICEELGAKNIAKTYASFMNALDTYADIFSSRLQQRYQALAEEVGERFWKCGDWVLIGFDGSRATTPRTVSNEKAFCAPNYGNGRTAKYRKEKSRGTRRKQKEKNRRQPPPQTWITMMWHMGLRIPWTWRLGPSNSSERDHVMEMLKKEEFPEKTLFCGDAGFVGYRFWKTILESDRDFLIRVGANVSLLSEIADIKQCGGGRVLCWPKDKMKSGAKPLRLRLVQVKIGKTKMWILTSVLNSKKLPKNSIVRFYKMRWGIEVEFRGLKQTIDKHTLRCRNSNRVLVELDWSIRAMALAELVALREQIPKKKEADEETYDPKDCSLANTMRALRQCMRKMHKYPNPCDELLYRLSQARVQKYDHHTDKKARYRPKNPDKKPLGDPNVRKMRAEERRRLRAINEYLAA